MSRVFFDTNLFIYLFEDMAGRGIEVADLIARMAQRGDELITSTLTLGELLVKPVELGNFALAATYEQALHAEGVTLVSFDAAAAQKYTQVRQDRTIKGPDAFQFACAASYGCDLFITNDLSLSRKVVSGIQFVVTLDRVPI